MARKDAEKYILDIVTQIDPSGINASLYEKRFKEMSDDEFDVFMNEIENGTNSIMINASGDATISHDRNLDILDKMGAKVLQKVTIEKDGYKIKPNVEYLILTCPFRRAAQHIKKNFSVHKHLKTRNANTGQVTGDSKAGSITYPEAHLINAMGLKNIARELLGDRGGDIYASHAYASLLFKNGRVTSEEMKLYRTKTGGALYIKALFKAKHLLLNN